MQLSNLKVPEQQVSFTQAVQLGLGQQQGLFFPQQIPTLDLNEAFWQGDFYTRAAQVLGAWLGTELGQENVEMLVRDAFNFAPILAPVKGNQYCLELFHGPTLAFKDFGARFLARVIALQDRQQALTILTATSGDTGAAVADAFYGLEGIKVVVLYPKGGISALQEKLFCTLGNNIHTIAIKGSFDDCQTLVKQAFGDRELSAELGLTSANSINIARLLAQICYYFEAIAQLPAAQRDQLVFSIPSGNFGNLTAAMLAKAMGAPIKRFIAATNSNDTVPRYLCSGQWQPNPTVATLSNAMDVSEPNNWPRIEALLKRQNWPDDLLQAQCIDEQQTKQALRHLYQQGYLSEPHGAVASYALSQSLQEGETGIFLGTAHPAKFADAVESILDIQLELPEALAKVQHKTILSDSLAADKTALFEYLRRRL